MTTALLYAIAGLGMFCLGLYALIVQAHLIKKVLALNIMGSGVFLLLVALASRTAGLQPDPVPHAMVITGIVVAVSATALALAIILRLKAATGQAVLSEQGSHDGHD